eukprot:Pgem_evm1s10020
MPQKSTLPSQGDIKNKLSGYLTQAKQYAQEQGFIAGDSGGQGNQGNQGNQGRARQQREENRD